MDYSNVCRIVPSYIAKHYKEFEIIPLPKYKVKNPTNYVLQIKKKIACINHNF